MKIQIDGVGTVEVGDDFAKMAPDAQNAFVAHISQQVASGAKSGMPGANLDKYQQAAQDDYEAAQKAGAPTIANPLMAKFTQGRMLGALPTVTAAMETPLEMIKRGTWNPVEGYNYAKAAENLAMQKAGEQAGPLGTAAEIAGGIGTGAGLAGKGYTLVKPGQGLAARALASSGEGAGYGAVTGFNEGEGVEGRLKGALSGGLLGGAVGGAIPVAGAAIKAATAPIVSNISARMDPSGYAKGLLARSLADSGKTPQELAQAVSDAAGAGQGVYTLADAMGKPGQELASTVARAPGEGQRVLADFLNARQAGQAERVGSQIDQALGTGPTAKQSVNDLIQQGKDASKPLYDKAMNVGPVWDNRIQEFLDDPIMKQGLATGVKMQRLEALAKGEKFDPHAYAITDFDAAGDPIISSVPNMRTLQAAKIGLDNLVEQHKNEFGNLTPMGRAIDMVRKSFLDKLNSYNPAYAEANAAFAGPAQVRDAIKAGQQAATRGRATDNIDAFNKLNPPSQQGFRIGYADTKNAALERGAEGVNAARPFTSEKAQTELPALSLYQGPNQPGAQDQLLQRISREQQMFETRNRALLGSKTEDNRTNAEAAGIDPRIFWNALHGNWGAAASNAIHAGVNGMTGNTAPVRAELAQLLLRRGNNADIAPLLDEIRAGMLHKQRIGAGVTRGLLAGSGEMSGQRR